MLQQHPLGLGPSTPAVRALPAAVLRHRQAVLCAATSHPAVQQLPRLAATAALHPVPAAAECLAVGLPAAAAAAAVVAQPVLLAAPHAGV